MLTCTTRMKHYSRVVAGTATQSTYIPCLVLSFPTRTMRYVATGDLSLRNWAFPHLLIGRPSSFASSKFFINYRQSMMTMALSSMMNGTILTPVERPPIVMVHTLVSELAPAVMLSPIPTASHYPPVTSNSILTQTEAPTITIPGPSTTATSKKTSDSYTHTVQTADAIQTVSVVKPSDPITNTLSNPTNTAVPTLSHSSLAIPMLQPPLKTPEPRTEATNRSISAVSASPVKPSRTIASSAKPSLSESASTARHSTTSLPISHSSLPKFPSSSFIAQDPSAILTLNLEPASSVQVLRTTTIHLKTFPSSYAASLLRTTQETSALRSVISQSNYHKITASVSDYSPLTTPASAGRKTSGSLLIPQSLGTTNSNSVFRLPSPVVSTIPFLDNSNQILASSADLSGTQILQIATCTIINLPTVIINSPTAPVTISDMIITENSTEIVTSTTTRYLSIESSNETTWTGGSFGSNGLTAKISTVTLFNSALTSSTSAGSTRTTSGASEKNILFSLCLAGCCFLFNLLSQL